MADRVYLALMPNGRSGEAVTLERVLDGAKSQTARSSSTPTRWAARSAAQLLLDIKTDVPKNRIII